MNILVKPNISIVVSLILIAVLGFTPSSSALDIGEKAPNFNLKSTTGKKISLSDFRGKKMVLVEFYGADFSPV